MREFFHYLDDPLLDNVPASAEEFTNILPNLSVDDLQKLIQFLTEPSPLLLLQQEWIYWHDKLYHAPKSLMFRLSKLGILPKHLLSLKTVPPCDSCFF